MAGHLGKHSRRLHVEPLEDRRMLAVVTVDTELDVIDAFDGLTSLREAIVFANSLAGADTIDFDASLAGETILLTQGELQITDDLTINGLGADQLTIDASGNDPTPAVNNGDGSRIFYIFDGSFPMVSDVGLEGVTLTGGDVSGPGGAIHSRENLTVTDSEILGNSAGSGGGIFTSAPLAINGSTISGNSASFTGGGVYAGFTAVTITDSTISDNSADLVGGGISAYLSDTVITDSTISGNSTGFTGGGIGAYGNTTTITGSTISGNSAGTIGGGITSSGTTTITDSTISGNSAIRRGGGIWAMNTTKIIGSTISGNTADIQGGGVYVEVGTTSIRHSTIVDNVSDADQDGVGSGGGLFVASGTVGVAHTMIANNTDHTAVGPDFTGNLGVVFDVLHSLISDNTGSGLAEAPVGSPDADGNLIGGLVNGLIDPKTGPLANNGGSTLTHALLPGSPAIDMGDPAAVAGVGNVPLADQRGGLYTRVFGGRIDIGAVESQPQPADFDGDGSVTGFDFLAWQRGFGTPAPLAVKSDGDADDDTDVDGDDLVAWENAYGASAPAPLVVEFAVVGDDTARFESRAVRSPATGPFSHAQLVDLALATHFIGAFDVAENPSPRVFEKWASLQGRGTDGAQYSREEAFATLDVLPWQDEDAAVVLAGEHRFDLAGDFAERHLAHQGLQSLEDVPLSGEFFPDL